MIDSHSLNAHGLNDSLVQHSNAVFQKYIIPGKTALIVAHPDDEVLWGGGLLTRYQGLDVICCSVPRRDPERTLCFFKAMKLLGHFPILLPFDEQTAETPLPHLHLLDLASYETIITHNAVGEYGHLQHKQVHAYISDRFEGNIFCFGFGSEQNELQIQLTPEEREKKLAALKCYDNQSSADGGLQKWDALLKRYNLDIGVDTYSHTKKGQKESACGDFSNEEIRARSDYQIFTINEHGISNIGDRLQKKLQALSPILPDFKGLSVLDIGCDFGFWSFLAAVQGAEVVGLDRSRPVKNLGHVNIPLLNNQTAKSLKLNAKFYDYEAGRQWMDFKKFDVVLCMSLYHHIYNVCQDHDAVWYWLSRVTGKMLIWENPIDVSDSVVQQNVAHALHPFYNPETILKSALKYFDIVSESPALHEVTRVVWQMQPKLPAGKQYQGTPTSNAGGASKTFLFENGRRIKELEVILGKTMVPGSLNLVLNENFNWDSHYLRAQVLDVIDRSQGWAGEWALKWVRLYPLVTNYGTAWAFRFEGEHYPLNFVELISDQHLRTAMGNNEHFLMISK